MKQTFTLEINCPAIEKEGFSRFSDNVLRGVLLAGMKDFFKKELMNGLELSVVEQTCGTPENTSENSKKPLRLSGNIAWENKIEDGDDYLDDRINSLIDR